MTALAEHRADEAELITPTYDELLVLVDHLTRDKERALYELHIMRGNGVIDLGKLERSIKGDVK